MLLFSAILNPTLIFTSFLFTSLSPPAQDCGQKKFGPITCKVCHMFYNQPEDNKEHAVYHKKYLEPFTKGVLLVSCCLPHYFLTSFLFIFFFPFSNILNRKSVKYDVFQRIPSEPKDDFSFFAVKKDSLSKVKRKKHAHTVPVVVLNIKLSTTFPHRLQTCARQWTRSLAAEIIQRRKRLR